MKLLVTEEDFRLVENPQVELYGIEILTGDYEKVIFTFGKVSIKENKDTGDCGVNFDFRIEVTNDKYTIDELNESVHFKNYIAEILGHILDKWDTHKNDEHTTADLKKDL